MVDAVRWEDGLKACENAMSVLPSATHLPLSKWKVSLNTEKAIVMTSVFDSVIPLLTCSVGLERKSCHGQNV